MMKLIIAATAAGTALVAVPAPAQAAGWQLTSGSTTVEAVNPCTGAPIDLTFQWSEAHAVVTESGRFSLRLRGTYVGTDGSTGSVRVTEGTAQTSTGYTDVYRQQAVGRFEGKVQRISFVFRVVVGETVDVKTQRTGGTCGGS